MKRSTLSLFICLLLAVSAASTRPALAQDPFVGEVRLVGFNFCPRGWTEASGQLLPIAQYQALFSLYGTIYGGDGQTTFALPDLRGRAPIHEGQGAGLQTYTMGQRGGAESITLTPNEIPSHAHAFTELSSANGTEEGIVLRSGAGDQQASTTSVGGSQGHENRPPYLVMRYCVALEGIYPSRN
ncbi:MAG: tail fiber protein [Rhodothermales bacterium]